MAISGCLNFRNPLRFNQRRGFTLIEILVVLLLISILTGVAVTRLPAIAQNSDFELEANRLELLLNMARTEALLDSVELGFRLTDDGYEFLGYDDLSQSWLKLESPFQARVLPEDIRLNLKADKQEFAFGGDDKVPPVLILSSGETTPLNLTIESRGRDKQQVLSTDGYAEFGWVDDDD